MSTLTPTGSLTLLMDELVGLEETVHEDLAVYRWRPRSPDLEGGMIWNDLGQSPFNVMDVRRWRDTINLIVSVGIRHTDVDEEMNRLEVYADAFRDVVDDALWNSQPLNNTTKRAHRTGMRMKQEQFNNIPVLALEFQFEMWLDRQIVAND